uniref:Uncharacterized protein n=1 Tax=Stegastes partitus TaxID=144197 RepID=A0A3B4ZFZ5_9TELE
MRGSARARPTLLSVTLQPWLIGLTAVVGFLIIVFAVLIIHRLLKRSRYLADTLRLGRQDTGDSQDSKVKLIRATKKGRKQTKKGSKNTSDTRGKVI